MKIIYEPHPVSPERKAALVRAGFKIIDAKFAPESAIVDDEVSEPARWWEFWRADWWL